MEATQAIDLARQALQVCMMVGGPILLIGLVIGLVVGAIQSMTGIHDPTVSFVPKIILTLVLIAVALPWLSQQLLSFSKTAFEKPWSHRYTSNSTFDPNR